MLHHFRNCLILRASGCHSHFLTDRHAVLNDFLSTVLVSSCLLFGFARHDHSTQPVQLSCRGVEPVRLTACASRRRPPLLKQGAEAAAATAMCHCHCHPRPTGDSACLSVRPTATTDGRTDGCRRTEDRSWFVESFSHTDALTHAVPLPRSL